MAQTITSSADIARICSPTRDEIGRNFNPEAAGQAIAKGIQYLSKRLGWSYNKIANILHIPANTFKGWIDSGLVPVKSLPLKPEHEVVIHLLAIHQNLEAMFDDVELQRQWLTSKHPLFNDTPENMMSSSTDGLISIRRYLDYERGRGA